VASEPLVVEHELLGVGGARRLRQGGHRN
jgi:hypothetical protein